MTFLNPLLPFPPSFSAVAFDFFINPKRGVSSVSSSASSSATVPATSSAAESVSPAPLPGCAPRSIDVEGPWCATKAGRGAGFAVSKVSTPNGQASGHTRRRRRRRGRITDRDRAIVRWIARQRFATAEIIARRFGMDRSRAYRRLRILTAAGLVEHHRIFLGAGVYLATAHGIAVVDLTLPPAKVDIRSYHHDLGLAALCADYELADHPVLTEREIRAADSFNPTPSYAVLLGDRNLHFPDLIVCEDRGLVAVELERTTKRTRRIDQILSAYLRARHLDAVRYHATDSRVEHSLLQAIARTHADSLIEVVGPERANPPALMGGPVTEKEIT